ncbi:hypothetical protein EVAR_3459_1 [Eumeta japonica]|uniref:RanBP2-type domain-containing protein n=1 Tax=Eumeta variegata TaxID=151549 RepID=A0A4C1ST80_EUMVA|nr:hypothetical protein EVAR_3459_1 [Eumeta japonica]
MIRSNTLAVPSYKPSSSYSDGRRLNIDLQSLHLSPTQRINQAHGVTRSLSHGSVINNQQKWWNIEDGPARSTINRPTSLMVSDRPNSYDPYSDPSRESFLRSLHTVIRRPKKADTKSSWEINYVKDYQKEQSKALHLKKWACNKCTLENSGIRTNCEACLSPRVSPLAACVSSTRGLSVTTLGRHEKINRDGATSLPSSGGVMITVPDWPHGNVILNSSFRRSISAQNSPEIRPTYRRSFSEQNTDRSRPLGKVVSSRRSLNDYQKSLANYCSSVNNKKVSENSVINDCNKVENKKDDSNIDLIDKECSWDTNAEGVIYALPNKGKYKDLNLQLQVNNNGTRYSYVSVQDTTKNVMSNSQNEVLYSNDLSDGDYARIDELLGSENCISPVNSIDIGPSNLRTSHIGVAVPRDPSTKLTTCCLRSGSGGGGGGGGGRMWQCSECWFAYNAWWARVCDVCRAPRTPRAPVTLPDRDVVDGAGGPAPVPPPHDAHNKRPVLLQT